MCKYIYTHTYTHATSSVHNVQKMKCIEYRENENADVANAESAGGI